MSKLRYNPLFIFWHLLKNDIHKLEYDPKTQWKFHLLMTRFWFFNLFVALGCYFLFPGVWSKASILYLVVVSLYANGATDFGAVPSSYAAMKTEEIQQSQTGMEHITLPMDDKYMLSQSRSAGLDMDMAHAGLVSPVNLAPGSIVEPDV